MSVFVHFDVPFSGGPSLTAGLGADDAGPDSGGRRFALGLVPIVPARLARRDQPVYLGAFGSAVAGALPVGRRGRQQALELQADGSDISQREQLIVQGHRGDGRNVGVVAEAVGAIAVPCG